MVEDGDEIIVLDDDNKPQVIYKGLKAYIMVDGKMVEVQEGKGKNSGKAKDTGIRPIKVRDTGN